MQLWPNRITGCLRESGNGCIGWSYVVGYVEDPQEMLDELHKAALAEGNDYLCQPETSKPTTRR